MNAARFLAGALASTAVCATFVLSTSADAAPQVPAEVKIVRDGVTLVHTRTPVTAKPQKGQGPTRSDFDGDGRDDIASHSHGGVVVTYSSAPVRDLLVTETVGDSGCSCFGWEVVTGNFNGDKYDDLAIGDYAEADVKVKGYYAGAVWIALGGPAGLKVDAVKHINQSTPGVPGTSVSGDFFADSLAAGDITADGRDELLIGVPFKEVSGKKDAGAAIVLKGSSTGIVTTGALAITQNTAGVPGGAETSDHFGAAVAIGKINKDKYQDIVIGAPQEDENLTFNWGSGVVTQFWGSAAGVSLKKVTAVTGHDTHPVAYRQSAVLWYFGGTLAIADTTGDGLGEVVLGVGGAQAGQSDINGGVVATLPGRTTGLSVKGLVVLSLNDKNIAGVVNSDDWFGASIATGDITGDGIADVLVGVPGRDVGKAVDAGEVVLLRGSAKGLTGVRSQVLTQSSAGIPDSAERGDAFGFSVSVLNLNGSARMDAAVGAPEEMVTGDENEFPSGAVTKLYGVGSGLGNGVGANGRSLGVAGLSYGRLAHQ